VVRHVVDAWQPIPLWPPGWCWSALRRSFLLPLVDHYGITREPVLNEGLKCSPVTCHMSLAPCGWFHRTTRVARVQLFGIALARVGSEDFVADTILPGRDWWAPTGPASGSSARHVSLGGFLSLPPRPLGQNFPLRLLQNSRGQHGNMGLEKGQFFLNRHNRKNTERLN
jgi:hypothetical protein